MAGKTFELINTTSVGSGGSASITFSSIPQTYTDLQIVVSGRCSVGDTSLIVRFNGITTNYSSYYLETNIQNAPGAGVSTTPVWGLIVNSGFTASIFANTKITILNYINSNAKVVQVTKATENNANINDMGYNIGYWNNTSAISSISLTPNSGSLVQYSTATLYGIKSS